MTDEEDMDIVDIEEEETDLGDDSWDEFDETPKDALPEGEIKPAKIKPAKSAKKSSKAFNAIILIVVALGGGAFFFGKYLFPSPTAAPGEQPPAAETAANPPANGIVELSDESAPPMPAPIESTGATETADAGLTPAPVPVETPAETSSGGELTPMPGKEGLAPAPSAALNAAPAPAAPVQPVEPVAPSADAGLIPLPVPGEPAAEEPPAAPEVALAPIEVTENETSKEEKIPEVPLSPPAVETPAPAPVESPAPVAASPDPALKDKISELEKSVDDLKAILDKKDETIATLKDQIKELSETQTAAVETPAPVAEKPAKPVLKPAKRTPAPKPAPVQEESFTPPAAIASAESPEAYTYRSMAERQLAPASVSPAPATTYLAVPAAPKAATPVKAAPSGQWELRSARPGQAILAPKGSNELKTVSVGDTINGLGRITSINLEGGVWTVRGTKGQVFR